MTARTPLEWADVHVWRIALQVPESTVARSWDVLSADEQRRATRFWMEGDRRRFVVSHGTLRLILAQYVGDDPRRLRFSVSRHGKPSLAAASAPRFNLTHSRDMAGCIVAYGREVGIDVEWLRPIPEMASIAQRFFSRSEQEALRAAPLEERCHTFHQIWTRKEAYIKARGTALSSDLQAFSVSADPRQPAVRTVDDECDPCRGWTLGNFETQDGYVGAFAVEGIFRHAIRLEWRHE